jgi:mannose-6-phosphate isomerase-like protein (cupin superfamily)
MPTATDTRTYLVAAHAGRPAVWWLGGRVAVKTAGDVTDGSFSQIEFADRLGTAPPVHIHHQEDETFYVVEGEISVFVDDERLEASAGDFVFAPRGVPHSYLVRSERSRVLCTFSPAGLEQFFAEMGIPAVAGEPEPAPVIPDPDTFTRALARYGVEVVAPPPELS